MTADGAFDFLQTASPWLILLLFVVAAAVFFVVALVKQLIWISASHNQVMRPLLAANQALTETNKELLAQNGKLIEQADIAAKFFQEADKVKGAG